MPHKDPIAKRLYMREYVKRRRLQDPEFRRKLNERTLASRKKPEGARKHAESNARYKQRHPERVKETQKVQDRKPHRVAARKTWWVKLDLSIKRAFEKEWRIKRELASAKNGGTCTLQQWRDRCALYGNSCAYCGTSLERKAEMDHRIPVAKGGSGWPANLVPACRHCNARKNTARWLSKLPRSKES